MTNRRRFIGSGLAVSVAASALPRMAGAAPEEPLRLDWFVFDHRFPESAEIARHVARQGVRVAGIEGDLTDLWYDHLDLAWKAQPQALAGVTTRDALFVLETLAADHRMRVVYRGEHAAPLDGRVAHALKGPASLIRAADPAREGALWGQLLAWAMTRCPLGAPSLAAVSRVTEARASPARAAPLYSWIIAPRSAVALTV